MFDWTLHISLSIAIAILSGRTARHILLLGLKNTRSAATKGAFSWSTRPRARQQCGGQRLDPRGSNVYYDCDCRRVGTVFDTKKATALDFSLKITMQRSRSD